MGRIQDLQNQLQLHNRQIRFGTNLSESDQIIHTCITDLIELQIECEKFRESYRRAFLGVKYKPRYEKAYDEILVGTKTYYNWEELTKETFRIIDLKEANGIQYYGDKIKEAQEKTIRTFAEASPV